MALASRWRSDKEEVVAENGIVTAPTGPPQRRAWRC